MILLTGCACRSSTSVSLKAREVLILGQMPSYEERLIQMESVLKNSVANNYYGEQAGSANRYVALVCLRLIVTHIPLGHLLPKC